MMRTVSATELAGIVSRLLTDPQGVGEIEEAHTFSSFMTGIAQVVADHCGGAIVAAASRTDKDWTVAVAPNDSLPATGGVWGPFDASQHRDLFAVILDATRVCCDDRPEEDLVVRRDLIAHEYLSDMSADLVITSERIMEDALFGEALHWMAPHGEPRFWEGRTLSEFFLRCLSSHSPEKSNAIMLRTDRPNAHGVMGEYVTIDELRRAVPTEAGAWRLPDGKLLKFL